MQTIFDQSRSTSSPSASGVVDAIEQRFCFHCGNKCPDESTRTDDKFFCCTGCLSVFELLAANELTGFYTLAEGAGSRISIGRPEHEYNYLDDPSVRRQMVDFSNDSLTRVTLRLPAIHCVACVWLLENLFRLNSGIGNTQVNFARKELSATFDPAQIKLSAVVALVASLGYPPDFKLSDLREQPATRSSRRLWLQLGIAGFAFGNTMLFSISGYLGLDSFAGPSFKNLVGLLGLLLAIPVVTYSAMDYWRSAWVCAKRHVLSIDVPIAAGIAALFLQSCFEVITGRGEGYFDSLCGLLFFLLSGKLFQQKSFDRLAFDRDYKSFFPLSVSRLQAGRELKVSLSQLVIGDHLVIRNGELIPADSILLSGHGMIDYSFVTGEADLIKKSPSDYLFSGGRQAGGSIEIELVKGVSQSYLTSLWNQSAFGKPRVESFNEVTHQYSKRFTKIVVAVAFGSALAWGFLNPSVSLKAFTSVLIVACPCALALAAPFALGTAQRVLGRHQVFLKNPYVLETLAKVDTVVFDKTGTLTASGAGDIQWQGRKPLSEQEKQWITLILRNSTHPLATRLCDHLGDISSVETIRSFVETEGCGVEGTVSGHQLLLGSEGWVKSRAVIEFSSSSSETASPPPQKMGSEVHVSIDGIERGHFLLKSSIRPHIGLLLSALGKAYKIVLLSGDNETERPKFLALFGPQSLLRFNQTPIEKLHYVASLQSQGATVMMVGDGLNDAGALHQSDIGVAVVENIGSFSPASDIILDAAMIPRLAEILQFSKTSMRIVKAAFLISTLYNLVGISIAATGRLSPLVCAILMPLSSVTVVAFSCGMTSWIGSRSGLKPNFDHSCARKVKP